MKEKDRAQRVLDEYIRTFVSCQKDGGEIPGSKAAAKVLRAQREQLQKRDAKIDSSIKPASGKDTSNRSWDASDGRLTYHIIRKRVWVTRRYLFGNKKKYRKKGYRRLNAVMQAEEGEQRTETMLSMAQLPDFAVPYNRIALRSLLFYGIMGALLIGIGYGAYGTEGMNYAVRLMITAGVLAAAAVFVLQAVVIGISSGAKSIRYEISKSLFEQQIKETDRGFIPELFLNEVILKLELWLYEQPDSKACDLWIEECLPKRWNQEEETAEVIIRGLVIYADQNGSGRIFRKTRREEFQMKLSYIRSSWPDSLESLEHWSLISCLAAKGRNKNPEEKEKKG